MNPDLRSAVVALVGGTALLIATCDNEAARALSKAIFLEPERSFIRTDQSPSTPEGLRRQHLEPFTKPESGFPILRPSSRER